MTSTRFRECLALLHWSQQGLSRILDTDERQVRRWAGGSAAVPPTVAAWLEVLAQHAAAYPAPAGR
jgi:DNA-binding transcriptional regulator YiaG